MSCESFGNTVKQNMLKTIRLVKNTVEKAVDEQTWAAFNEILMKN